MKVKQSKIAQNPVEQNGDSPAGDQPDLFDPFKPENIRIDQAYLARGGMVKKAITVVPVRKPNKQAFIRVHASPEYRVTAALIDVLEDRDTYLVARELTDELSPTEYYFAVLHLYITRSNTIGLWPVKLPGPDGRKNEWHTSAAIAAEKAMERWVRVQANMELGGYEVLEAIGNFSEPEWPDLLFGEYLRIAFKVAYVDTLEHPVIKRLRGEI